MLLTTTISEQICTNLFVPPCVFLQMYPLTAYTLILANFVVICDLNNKHAERKIKLANDKS